MSPQHFSIIRNHSNLQKITNLPETPFKGVTAIKINSLKGKKAAKVRIPINLLKTDIVVVYWSGWIQAPGHTPKPYADGGLSISLLDAEEKVYVLDIILQMRLN